MIIEHVRAAVPHDSVESWPFTLAPVAQLADAGIAFERPVTFLVGENGSGKSTIIEAIAEAYGINPRGGRAKTKKAAVEPESVLSQHLDLELSPQWSKRKLKGHSYFLRAETAFDFLEFISSFNIIVPGYWQEDLRVRSHGEGFLTVLETIFAEPGLYLMDEPESALSFTACLRLLALMEATSRLGSQIVCATHSPVLASLPGAQILELGEHGIRQVPWADLEVVEHWKAFLNRPESYHRHLLDGP